MSTAPTLPIPFAVAYCNSVDALQQAGSYTRADGSPSVAVACIFAANLNATVPDGNTVLAPNVPVPSGGAILNGNPTIMEILGSGVIATLQAKGIKVLLTVLGNHDAAGWSNFDTEAQAANFAAQLVAAVQTWGLDGIDIDDEYSSPACTNTQSLAMVTTLIRRAMPGKILSKALFSDSSYFQTSWNGNTLGANLTNGWQMSYGAAPRFVLPAYVGYGMSASTLAMGFWTQQPSSNPSGDVTWLKDNGYGGVMVYAFGESGNTALLGQLLDDWLGPGNFQS